MWRNVKRERVSEGGFHPNLVMVPSLPFRLVWPAMPSALLPDALGRHVGQDHPLGNLLDQPEPERRRRNTEDHVFWATWLAKSSCEIEQPGASLRPLITNNPCTPPSRVPSALSLNRASRTGPSGLMNDGTVLRAPMNVAMATRGFCAGVHPGPEGMNGADDVPATAGCE